MNGYRQGRHILPESPGRAGQPYWVAEALCRRDPSFRIRWSWEKDRWVAEAKAKGKDGLREPFKWLPVDGIPGYYKAVPLPELSDRRIGWRDGYYQMFYIRTFDERVYHQVVMSDMLHYKSAKHAERAISAAEDAETARADRHRENEMEAHSREVASYAMTKCGTKGYMRSGASVGISNEWW